MNGIAPKELTPNLYKVARYKMRTVAREVRNHNWIKNCKKIDTPELIEEFALLFMALANITLTEQEDEIR